MKQLRVVRGSSNANESRWLSGALYQLRPFKLSFIFACSIASTLLMSACGGAGSPENSTPSKPAEVVLSLEVAQTHVLPPEGLRWPNFEAGHLRVVAERDVLILAHLTKGNMLAPNIEAWQGVKLLGRRQLANPEQLPATEGGDKPYATTAWSAVLPANWVAPGLSVRVVDGERALTALVPVSVAPKVDVTLQMLPFVLFGASKDVSGIMNMSDQQRAQASAGMPFSKTHVVEHPIGAFESNYVIIPPVEGLEAYKVSSADSLRSTKYALNHMADIAQVIHAAAGDRWLNRVTYASITMLNSKKEKIWLGSGGVSLPGTGSAASDPTFGYLWHEGGHAMSLGHSGEESSSSPPLYAYAAGSLKGSVWGFDQVNNYFRSTLTTPNSLHATCDGDKAVLWGATFQKDSNGRCYRFDPMQSADDQMGPNAEFPLFSDFNSSRMLQWALNRTHMNDEGNGLKRLDASGNWTSFTPVTEYAAQFGLLGQFPAIISKQLDFIYITHSLAGTKDISQFYKPVRHTGNATAQIDPLDNISLQKINPDQVNGKWMEYDRFCKETGCDFTLKATYQDSTTAYRILRGSSRQSWEPRKWKDDYLNAKSKDSFLQWAVNLPIPASGAKLQKLELLETPTVWAMSPAAIAKAPVAASLVLH